MSQILRHVNGGAQKVGSEVHVSVDSFCGEDCQISGMSTVIESTLSLRSNVMSSHILGSLALSSTLIGSVCSKSRLMGVYGEGVIFDRVEAESSGRCALSLIEVVAENCQLYGDWTLEGNARIPTGIWHRAPRYKHITGENGVDIGLTESTDGHALMACWRKPIRKWLMYGPRLGIKHGWTEKQINDARLFFEEILDVPMEGVISNAA